MSESAREETTLPWSSVLILASVLAGFFFQKMTPFEALRPTDYVPPVRSGVTRGQDVPARLWEDPIDAVAQRVGRTENAHTLAKVADQSKESGTKVLAILTDDRRYTESHETRIRRRYAVLSALDVAGYQPKVDNKIGFFLWFPIGSDEQSEVWQGPAAVPYEWFEQSSSARNSLLVLWLPESAFAERPLERLRQLAGTFANDATGERFAILGPSSSDTLLHMADEAEMDRACRTRLLATRGAGAVSPRDEHAIGLQQASFAIARSLASGSQWCSSSLGEWPRHLVLYSPIATAEAALLLAGMSRSQPQEASEIRLVDDWPHEASEVRLVDDFENDNVRFVRTTQSDYRLAKALVDELKLRGVDVRQSPTALVAEWDTEYGRTLPKSFIYAACGRSDCPIQRFDYLRGLDGSPAAMRGEAEGTDGGADAKPAGSESVLGLHPGGAAIDRLERPVGDAQLDYVRRLADYIDTRLRGKDGSAVAAIGVLGSDVYDKLLILQALREHFPEAIFFTTDLDARYLQASERRWARNLLVASSFGLRLQDGWQGAVPPFRDSYQTGLFYSVQRALADGRRSNDQNHSIRNAAAVQVGSPSIRQALGSPRIFEIGRTGAIDLSAHDGSVQPAAGQHMDWHRNVACGGLLILGGMLLVFGSWRLRALLADPRYAIPAAGFVLVLLWLGFVIYSQINGGEPFSVLEGVSIWPVVILRTVTAATCVFLVIRAMSNLNRNAAEISKMYGLSCDAHLDRVSPQWLLRWPSVRRWADGEGPIALSTLWTEYLWFGVAKRRSIRVAGYAVLFLAFGMLAIDILGHPNAPYRGPVSKSYYFLSLVVSVVAVVVLTYFVVDATRLCRAFVRQLRRRQIDFPDRLLECIEHTGLEEADCHEWVGVRLIARRTKVVSQLIIYPFVALLLMLMARSPVFDRLSFPISLVLIFSAMFAYALACGVQLRGEAEAARGAAMERLGQRLLAAKGSDEDGRARQLEQAIGAIAKTSEGAFASFTRHPIVHALALPSGGFGAVSLLQYLFR